MTKDEAEAILLAERVLQTVGCEGPDAHPGLAWYKLVNEAALVVADDRLLKSLCDGLHILDDPE